MGNIVECCHCHKVGDTEMLYGANFDLTENLRAAAENGTLYCQTCHDHFAVLLGWKR